MSLEKVVNLPKGHNLFFCFARRQFLINFLLIGHNGNDSDVPEATHIRGTVSVTDMRLISNDDDSEHSANDSIHVPTGGIKSPAINNNVGDLC